MGVNMISAIKKLEKFSGDEKIHLLLKSDAIIKISKNILDDISSDDIAVARKIVLSILDKEMHEKNVQKQLYNNFIEYAYKASGRKENSEFIGKRVTAWSLASWTIRALNGEQLKIYDKNAFKRLKENIRNILDYKSSKNDCYDTVCQISLALDEFRPLNTVDTASRLPLLVLKDDNNLKRNINSGVDKKFSTRYSIHRQKIKECFSVSEIVENSAISVASLYLIAFGIAATVSMSMAVGVPVIIVGLYTLAVAGIEFHRTLSKKQKKNNFEKLQARLFHEINPHQFDFQAESDSNSKRDKAKSPRMTLFGEFNKATAQNTGEHNDKEEIPLPLIGCAA